MVVTDNTKEAALPREVEPTGDIREDTYCPTHYMVEPCRVTCPVHIVHEPCQTCAAYIAAGL